MASKITAAQVKELRDKTQVGMMDAKKALVASEGDMDKAIDFLREKGIAKAKKKSGNVAANGLARVKEDGNTAAIIEVNSETDFVATNDTFNALVDTIADTIAEKQPADLDAALALMTADGSTINDAIVKTTQVTSENVQLRRFAVVKKTDGQVFGSYLHQGGQIAAVVVLDGADEATAKDVAMHVAAINPEFVSRDDIPAERLDHEREVLKQEALNEGKPEKIVEKMVEGRLHKFLSEISLADQPFVKDGDQTVSQFVASKGGKLVTFVRYEVGEGIEKPVADLAKEVQDQING
ncbi:translation elongation factor Ts [Levilactobacillus brevis]|uniref:translation elongation factor Ts n=1 Tax=Levilactobacillus brevis TaxID=1580 RepID=UPI000E08EAF8|nr:translation elongation factor Ts [Levilactobacillus brevis]MBT9676622.1 elongation factor Ts [Levilactobacillus brevis]RDF87839.1 elongation factor Ts [Levilactobacillus brevis]